VIPKCGHCRGANFQVLTDSTVFRYVVLGLATESFVNRSLTSNSGLPGSLSATTRLFDRPPVPSAKASSLGGQLAPGQFATKPSLQLCDMRGLFASGSSALSAQFFL
jgi:hypothetical protein